MDRNFRSHVAEKMKAGVKPCRHERDKADTATLGVKGKLK